MNEQMETQKFQWLARVHPESVAFFTAFIDRLDAMRGLKWYLGQNGDYLGIVLERAWKNAKEGRILLRLSDTYPHGTPPYNYSFDALRIGYDQHTSQNSPTIIKLHLDGWITELISQYGAVENSGDHARYAVWQIPEANLDAGVIADSLEGEVNQILRLATA